MSTRAVRAITYTVVVLLAVLALQSRPPAARRPVHLLSAPVTVPTDIVEEDTLKWGETLAALLARHRLQGGELVGALRASPMDARRIRAGMVVSLRGQPDSVPVEITLHASPERIFHLRRGPEGWTGEEELIPWATDTLVAHGMVATTLVHAFPSTDAFPTQARDELAYDVADIFEYRVDMSRDLRVGDSVSAVFERLTHPTAGVRIGRVIAATLKLSGSRTEAVRFDGHGYAEYFDQEGKSMRSAFLRAPLAFRRISSVFGMRRHPILGVMRKHAGTDYAAASGTPVRSVGNGVVIFAGRRGGYGNVLEIRHPNGFVTRYAHLRGFARGVSRGARVNIAQTVAYVGSTGLSTAPHLHFEVLANGMQRDPRVALAQKGGQPVPATYRAAFDSLRDVVSSLFVQAPDVVALGQ